MAVAERPGTSKETVNNPYISQTMTTMICDKEVDMRQVVGDSEAEEVNSLALRVAPVMV